MSDYDHNCLFIGGLNPYLTTHNLKQDLKHMLNCINIRVALDQLIIVNNRNTGNCYGFVYLNDRGAVDYVLGNLRTKAGRRNVPFDFSKIQDPNKRLKFNYRKWDGGTTQLNPRDMQQMGERTSAYEHCYTETARDVPNVYVETSVQNENSNTQTSMETSVNSSPPNPPERFYYLNQQLGNETRTMEFKQGGFMRSGNPNILEETVGRYVCAFLNTNGGTLFIGVDDDGRVVGVTCNQRDEDKHRRSIDHAIKEIQPLVLTSLYTADFVPVMNRNNSFSSNLKVLEVKVNTSHDYYDYKDDFYIRRDGSVQMLNARDRREWVTKGYVNRLEQVLREKEKLKDKVMNSAEQVQALQEENRESERQLRVLKEKFAKLKKSKICSIS